MNWWVLRHLSSSSSWSVFKFKHSIEEGDWPPHGQLPLETIKETINYQRRGLSSSWAASDSDYKIHSLVSLELGSLQSYCPLETHLYQERLRWKSQQPCYPPFGISHIFPFHYILIKCSPVFNSDCVLLARNLWQKLHHQKSEWRHTHNTAHVWKRK